MEPIVYLLFMSLLWIVYYLSIYIYYKKFSQRTKNYDSLTVVHQNCFTLTAKYIYLFKLYYGKNRKKFSFPTIVKFEFSDEKDRIFSTVKIPSNVLMECLKEGFKEDENTGKARLLAFVLKTKISLLSACAVKITHDSKTGDLPVGSAPNVQTFVCSFVGRNTTNIKPSPNPNYPEITLFFLFGVHWILLHTQYYITNDQLENVKRYDSLTTMSLTALLSAIIALLLVTITQILYYLYIKRIYSNLRGIGFVWLLKVSYLFAIISMSLVFGVTAASKGEVKKEVTDSGWDSGTLKWCSLIIAIIIYSLSFFTIVLVINFFGFLRDSEKYDLHLEADSSYKSIKVTKEEDENTNDSNKSILEVPISSADGTQKRDKKTVIKPKTKPKITSKKKDIKKTDTNLKRNP